MEGFDDSKFIGYLPTEERREYAKRLNKYAEYFQAQMDFIEGRTVKDRIIDNLHWKKKEEEQKRLQRRIAKYDELVRKMFMRSQEEYVNKVKDSVDIKSGKLVDGGKSVDSVLGMAMARMAMARMAGAGMATAGIGGGILGSGIANGVTMLNDLTGLSDKQQLAMYKKFFETTMLLLQQSDVSEEKIKFALVETMNKIGDIKEKYDDIEDDDLLAQKIQDECVVEIIEGIEKTSDYNKFQKHIKQTIGMSAWNKMTQNAQIFLITAELLYDQWKIYGNDIDFAPICMSVSKALEVEVTRRYFIGYQDYLSKYNEIFPDELMIKKNGSYRPKYEEEFMLGNITGVTGYAVYLDTETVKLVARLRDENQRFLKYAREQLFVGKKEVECAQLVKKHVYNIKKVCIQYRNPSAHKQKVTKLSARECLDYMIDVKKVMGEILDDCSW